MVTTTSPAAGVRAGEETPSIRRIEQRSACSGVGHMDDGNVSPPSVSEEFADLNHRCIDVGKRECTGGRVLDLGIDDEQRGLGEGPRIRRETGEVSEGRGARAGGHVSIVMRPATVGQWRKRLLSRRMRQVVVCVIPDRASLFELATPSGVWGPNRGASCEIDVEFVPCGIVRPSTKVEGPLELSGLELLADHVDRADMVVVPTWPITDRPVAPELVEMLVSAHDHGARLVGLCLGAFAVAATGLLDSRSATTHWRHRERFEADHPAVRYEPNTLYVDEGDVVTSAGSAAALDCCLHLLRSDHGAEVAAEVARSLVTAPHRDGAQSQFASAPPIQRGDDPISQALARAAENIGGVRGVDDLVQLAQTSRRSLERHLRARLGVSPREWIDEQRVITACRLLETSNLSIEVIAGETGYGSAPTLRRAMRLHRAMTPTLYRSAFQPQSKPSPRAKP